MLLNEEQLKKFTVFEGPFEKGYITKFDPSLNVMRGAFPSGQNMDIGTSGSPTVRLGTSVVGTENVASSTPTRSEWNFILRNGTEILMRSWGTRVEWYHAGTSDWTLLQSA